MAEERLIDDDENKDKKFKVRINENGEEELYIDEEQQEEELEFEVPEFYEDDEEAAVLTPEQLAERDRQRKQEAERLEKKCDELKSHARQLIEEKSFEGALYELDAVSALKSDDGQLAVLKIRALTGDFTDFSRTDELKSALSAVNAFSTGQDKEELSPFIPDLKIKAENLAAEVSSLSEENERKKGERRVVFGKRVKISGIAFGCVLGLLIVMAALAIYFLCNMHAYEDGRNIAPAIAFAICTGVCFVGFVVASRFFWKASHDAKRNENNSSTKLGRTLIEKTAEYEIITNILSAYGNTQSVTGDGNDIS